MTIPDGFAPLRITDYNVIRQTELAADAAGLARFE